MAFAQTDNNTYQGPIPEDNTTVDNNPLDIGNGPIPEDNSTNIYPGSESPSDISGQNSTFGNQGSTIPDVSSDLGNSFENTTAVNGTQTNSTANQPVPEFGSVSALVLIAAIASIILISAKAGLRFNPRY